MKWLLYFSVVSGTASAGTLSFELPTYDHLAMIQGQIDFPECDLRKYPAVLIVGGTGLFTRDGFFGKSRTERDFIFRDLSERLGKVCIASVRFDYRGVKCEITASTREKCLDQKTRTTVTDKTILDDIQVVYDHATRQPNIDVSNLVMIGHSEGSLNISKLVASNSIHPKGLMFFGGMTESAYSILHWQLVDRNVDWAFEMDTNSNGDLSNDEIKLGHVNSKLSKVPVNELLSKAGKWTRESLFAYFESIYKSYAQSVLSQSDNEPYLSGNLVFTNIRWWKRWFVDRVSVIENLKNFRGPIEYHNGDIDSQTPGVREEKFLEANSGGMLSRPNFVLHKGKGHGLSSDPLYGPIDDLIANQIITRINSWIITGEHGH